jgi:hypothetical protein
MPSKGERTPRGGGGGRGRPPASREAEYRNITDTVNDVCTDIKNFAKQYFSQRKINYDACSACLSEMLASWQIQSSSLATWKDFAEKEKIKKVEKHVKQMDGRKDLLTICARARDFEVMIPNARERLVTCVRDHLYKYCQSFVEEAGMSLYRAVFNFDCEICHFGHQI